MDRLASASDADLLRLSSCDPAAFDAFCGRYEHPLLGYFARRPHDPELTTDLAAEVFASALEHAERFDPQREAGTNAGPWLFGIAYHVLLASVRRGRVATGSALAATGIWRRQVGDEHRGKPTISASSVPAAQAAHFGILRREPNAADHGEKVRYALRYLDGRSFRGVRTDAVRLLSAAGSGYVLVPSTRAAGKDDALCLFAIDPADGGGLSCWTTAEILGHKSVLFADHAAQADGR